MPLVSSKRRHGFGNVPILTELPPPTPIDQFCLENVVCNESLPATGL
jgi:hypothetical protein